MLASQFTCYWDESGLDPGTETKSKSDTPILLVGGYMSHVDEWKTLDRRWKAVLSEAGIEYFHMVEFANLRLPYRNWSEEKRDWLIQSFLDIIADCPRIWTTWMVEIDAYMEVIKANNLLDKDIVRAYHICARKCIETVSTWAFAAGYSQKILHVFDQGNPAWPTFVDRFNQPMLNSLRILQPISQSKVDVPPLQAADILVHQVARHALLSSGRAGETQRLYTPRLFGKPGLPKPIGIPELKELYKEELILEEFRSRGQFPNRVINWDRLSRDNINAVSHLFVEPESYEVNKRIRELQ